ncbi:MAG: hypothetical protein ACFCVE_14820 [Phycisphaerae bacterium]
MSNRTLSGSTKLAILGAAGVVFVAGSAFAAEATGPAQAAPQLVPTLSQGMAPQSSATFAPTLTQAQVGGGVRDRVGYGFEQGDYTLTLGGTGANDNDFESSAFAVDANLGYFFTDQFAGVLRQTVAYTDIDSSAVLRGETRLAVQYYFDMDRFQPYVGANIGYLYGDAFDDTFAAGPEVGLLYFANSTTYIFARVNYDFFFEDVGDADDAFNDGQFVYGLGIGFRF